MFKKIFYIFSLLLLVLSIFFIFTYKLESIPNGLYVDEAVSGYNSYSLLETGKDEYGKELPIAMRFFASYSPPLYAYVSILPIKIFGLSVFSARIISALSGVASAFFVYLFLKELQIFSNKYNRLLGVFLFAISPWVVFFSRLGYEVYFGFFVFTVGTFFALKALKNPKYFLFSSFFLALSVYGSHTQKYLIFVFVPIYFLLFRKKIFVKNNTRLIFTCIIVSILLLLPYFSLFNTEAFQSKNDLFYSDAILHRANNYFLPLFLGKMVAVAHEFLARYLAYFSPKSLFFLPDPDPQRSMPELSVFYFWMVVPYFVGLLKLVTKLKQDNYKFLMMLLLISPIPAALTQDPFTTQRALPIFLPIFLVIALGLSKLLNSRNILFKIFLLLLILIYSPLMLWRSYFVLLPVERANVWGYGFKELVEEIQRRPNTTFVIDQTRLKPVYIEYAFFSKFDPLKMQALYSNEFVNNYYSQSDFVSPPLLDQINFRPIIWEEDICKEQILVGDYLSFSENNIREHFLSEEFIIKDPKGEILFQGLRTHPELKCKI